MIIRITEKQDLAVLYSIYTSPTVVASSKYLPTVSFEMFYGTIDLHSEYQVHLTHCDDKDVPNGHLGIFLNSMPRTKHTATFVIAVDESARKQGIGHRLVQVLTDQSDNWLNILRLEVDVPADAEDIVKLLEDSGFVVEGQKQTALFRNGEYVDMLMLARVINRD
ncbi:GNAT family N-acetyltransferase [Veronia pacifica]|uniref:N-acetyltransferase domain-containing protein n=1 Tax=Veronia pacifica TaxID=1080227 RepID=A0A1C3EPG5_9GAMM|nr:GNAT family N-acetyltransferase [Veronia pacifica]ODA35125.1 hypothetical protein A8L45_05460 [Veronia pacifica]